jgi:hypothetical protein
MKKGELKAYLYLNGYKETHYYIWEKESINLKIDFSIFQNVAAIKHINNKYRVYYDYVKYSEIFVALEALNEAYNS